MKRRGPPNYKKQGTVEIPASLEANNDLKPSAQELDPSPVCLIYRTTADNDSISAERQETATGLVDMMLSRPFSSWSTVLGEKESLLLEHYIQHFSRTYPTYGTETNPFLSVLLPMSFRNPLVLDSMLALSGVQMWTTSRNGMHETTLALRQRALSGCRRLLAQKASLIGSSVGDYNDDTVEKLLSTMEEEDILALLASIHLLLLYEKLSGEGKSNWMPHLDFVNQILSHVETRFKRIFQSSSMVPSSSEFAFLRSIFLYNDLVQSTSLRAPMHSDFYIRAAGEEEAGRYYYPHLIARISAGDKSVTDADIANWNGSMAWLPSFALSGKSVIETAEGYDSRDEDIITELYSIAAMVYRRQRLSENQLHYSDDVRSQARVLAALALPTVQRLPVGSTLENALLWPIGIVARSLDSEHQGERDIVIQRLEALKQRFHMRVFARAQEVLLDYWQMMDRYPENITNTAMDDMDLVIANNMILLG